MVRTCRIWFPILLISIFLLADDATVSAHALDELSVKSRIYFERDTIVVRISIAPGVLVSTMLLEELDPDKDMVITETEKQAFAQLVSQSVSVQLDGVAQTPQVVGVEVDPYDYLITGVGMIYVDLNVLAEPLPVDVKALHTFNYAIDFYDGLALYSLHLHESPETGVLESWSERDELTQAAVFVGYTVGDPVLVAEPTPLYPELPYAVSAESLNELPLSSIPVVDNILDQLQSGAFTKRMILVLLTLAVVAGALHAFTPGHGKTLVAAFLIANKGTPIHAVALGLLVTATHSASIFVLGGLVMTATQFFLPSRVIPAVEIVSGLLIVVLGLWMLYSRYYRGGADHAHVLPNLGILNQKSVNVLIDGNAADSVELFLIAANEPPVVDALHEAGAHDVNLCSLGCETHDLLPNVRPERMNLSTVKQALQTGAVDGIVVKPGKRQELINKLTNKHNRKPSFNTPMNLDDATSCLIKMVRRYPERQRVDIPERELTWGSLASLGFVGGMVPCPDALAILLVALSVGQLALGMSVVVLFSVGLSITLIAVGVAIVLTGRMVPQTSLLNRLSGVTPYVASVFITGIGVWMVTNVVRSYL